METLHELGGIIGDRDRRHHYQIVNLLGRGGMGLTYRALDLNNGQQVALKVISLRQIRDWKVLELFKREAKVLSRLDRQFIPAYLDYFELETEDDKRFYLVQELVEGKSLANLVADGWHGTELEIREVAVQLLNILDYLHSFDPPVIHRDIKPHNIIRRPDGRIYLVDFGAVQDIYRHTVSLGKTFVGTLGYMPLEQLRGDVSPASDLYSLGCTILFLLTHKSPTDLPQKGLSIDFSRRVNVSPRFKRWLKQILEPIVEDRFQSAASALQALQTSQNNTSCLKLPADSSILATQSANSLKIKIPLGVHYPKGFLPTGFKEISLGVIGFALLPEITAVCLLGWFFFFLSTANKPRKNSAKPPIKTVEKYVALEINAETFSLERSVRLDLSGELKIKRQEESTANIVWVNTIAGEGTEDRVVIAVVKQKSMVDVYFTQTNLDRETEDRIKLAMFKDVDTVSIPVQYIFGQGYLDRTEARWIAQEISNFIEQISK